MGAFRIVVDASSTGAPAGTTVAGTRTETRAVTPPYPSGGSTTVSTGGPALDRPTVETRVVETGGVPSVDYGPGGDRAPDAIAKRFLAELREAGCSVASATITTLPDTDSQVVSNLLDGN